MREIVIVIADLYPVHGAALAGATPPGAFPGIESALRFGERVSLARGWRVWLASSLGRVDLADVAPAHVAAAAVDTAGEARATTWIATPLTLGAHSSGTHLEHRGIVRLAQTDLTALAAAFRDTFGPLGHALTPLPSGDFLLETRGISAVATLEPARWAGRDVAAALPHGPLAVALRRFISEVEMWLHTQELNEARRRRAEPPVTTLWPWGGEGRRPRLSPGEAPRTPVAFGSEAYLAGLWRILGAECRTLPERFADVAAAALGVGAVVLLEVAAELRRDAECSLEEAMSRIDARFVSPALAALRRAEAAGVTLVVNDTLLKLGRRSHLRLWRRARAAGLGSFA